MPALGDVFMNGFASINPIAQQGVQFRQQQAQLQEQERAKQTLSALASQTSDLPLGQRLSQLAKGMAGVDPKLSLDFMAKAEQIEENAQQRKFREQQMRQAGLSELSGIANTVTDEGGLMYLQQRAQELGIPLPAYLPTTFDPQTTPAIFQQYAKSLTPRAAQIDADLKASEAIYRANKDKREEERIAQQARDQDRRDRQQQVNEQRTFAMIDQGNRRLDIAERGLDIKSNKADGAAKDATNFDNMISELSSYYDDLEKGQGITDPNKSGLDNAIAAAGSSDVGQMIGRTFGTANQSARNKIKETRPLLLQAIKQATGMSSKSLDSNTELKLFLATATDPQSDISAARAAINRLRNFVGSGTVKEPTIPATADYDLKDVVKVQNGVALMKDGTYRLVK